MTEFAGVHPATQAAADVERLMSEAVGLQRIVDLAGEVAEEKRRDPVISPDPSTGSAQAVTDAEPGNPDPPTG